MFEYLLMKNQTSSNTSSKTLQSLNNVLEFCRNYVTFYQDVCCSDAQMHLSWCRGVVVITTAQLHSTKPELRFCAGSNPACDVSEIRDGEDI